MSVFTVAFTLLIPEHGARLAGAMVAAGYETANDWVDHLPLVVSNKDKTCHIAALCVRNRPKGEGVSALANKLHDLCTEHGIIVHSIACVDKESGERTFKPGNVPRRAADQGPYRTPPEPEPR